MKQENARLTEERDLLKRQPRTLPRSNGGVRTDQTAFSVDSMCRFMTVSQSAYYAWLHRVQTTREKDDIELTTIIRDVFGKSLVPPMVPGVSRN